MYIWLLQLCNTIIFYNFSQMEIKEYNNVKSEENDMPM